MSSPITVSFRLIRRQEEAAEGGRVVCSFCLNRHHAPKFVCPHARLAIGNYSTHCIALVSLCREARIYHTQAGSKTAETSQRKAPPDPRSQSPSSCVFVSPSNRACRLDHSTTHWVSRSHDQHSPPPARRGSAPRRGTARRDHDTHTFRSLVIQNASAHALSVTAIPTHH